MTLLKVLQSIVNHPLNKDNKLQSMIRFLKWQIGSRLIPGEVIFNWVNGAKIIIRPGETGLTGNLYCGLQEFADMAFLLHVLRKEDLFVDVGANVGSYTILACGSIGSRGYSFEPIPTTYSRLMNNIFLNNITDRVKCLNIGIADKEDEIRFTTNQDSLNHVISKDEYTDHYLVVKVSTLDFVLKDEIPSLIKIDVEGYELPVLKGSQKILKKETLHSVIIELNEGGKRYGFDESCILNIMQDHGFRPYNYNPFNRELINLNGKNSSSENTLFIRNKEFVMDRVMEAPKVKVQNIEI